MEKFSSVGQKNMMGPGSFKYHLKIPKAKEFVINAVKNGEEVLSINELISRAVKRDKFCPFHVRSCIDKNGLIVDIPKTLQTIVVAHPYPLSQGPVIPPLDCMTEEKMTEREVINTRTMFRHNNDQRCLEWIPVGKTNLYPTYNVKDLKQHIQGTVCNSDMSLSYTCQKMGCIVHCSCSICRDKRVTCKLQCKLEVCSDCNSQCNQHELKLPRLFNPESDHFTLITEQLNKYRYANPHAGIPRSCKDCTNDVLEHQVLHLVFHLRCRFCRHAIRPFEHYKMMEDNDFKAADRKLNTIDERTCSDCLKQLTTRYKRVQHEDIVHNKAEKRFKCDRCEKSYSNENALSYHQKQHNIGDQKHSCDKCGTRFQSESILLRHKATLHEPTPNIECESCGKKFSIEHALKRHIREQHFQLGVNLDYVEDMENFNLIHCEYCDKKFKRKDHLKRHMSSSHPEGKQTTFKCSQCDLSFGRKDTVMRHVKTKHL